MEYIIRRGAESTQYADYSRTTYECVIFHHFILNDSFEV